MGKGVVRGATPHENTCSIEPDLAQQSHKLNANQEGPKGVRGVKSPLALCDGAACLPVILAWSSYDTQDSMPMFSLCMYYTEAVHMCYSNKPRPVIDQCYTGASACSIHTLWFSQCKWDSANTGSTSRVCSRNTGHNFSDRASCLVVNAVIGMLTPSMDSCWMILLSLWHGVMDQPQLLREV